MNDDAERRLISAKVCENEDYDRRLVAAKVRVYDAREAYRASMNGATHMAMREAERALRELEAEIKP